MRKYIIAEILAFFLTIPLFLAIPTRSIPAVRDYDPWADINDDGKIDIKDISSVARLFGTLGTPINKTELLLELQAQIDSLNASLVDLINQTRNIYDVEIKAYCPIENKDLSVEIMKNGITSAYNTTHTFAMIGAQTFTVPLNGPDNHTFTHWNTGSTNTTITVSSPGVYTAYYELLAPDWFNGLAGYWKLDEGNGNLTADSSGNNNNGTLENSPTWVSGKYGNALNFDGLDDSVNIPDSASLRLQTFTLEAWIYMTKRPYQHGEPYPAIINKLQYIGGGAYDGYKLQFEAPSSTDDNLVISVGDGSSQRFIVNYNSINDLTLNQWHHVAGTYDGTYAKIYIDGQLKATSQPGAIAITNDDAILEIGGEHYYSQCNFNGLIDNIMIYNKALSGEEEMLHFLLPPP